MASTTSDLRVDRAAAPAVRHRPPAAVLALGALSALQAVGLVAGALTGLDGLITLPARPSGAVVAALLVLLAGWVVLCAGGGALVVDGSSGRMLSAVACAEVVGVLALLLLSWAGSLLDGLPGALPLPALALLALAVPVGKLLLVGAPTAVAWLAAGPRARSRDREQPPVDRGVRAVTVAVIGLALVLLALTTPVPGPGADAPTPARVSGTP